MDGSADETAYVMHTKYMGCVRMLLELLVTNLVIQLVRVCVMLDERQWCAL
jgi:hypothetical protein